MSDPKRAAHGKMASAVRAALLGYAALMATGCALQPGSTNENGGGAATGRYQFGYVLSSPSDIQAQVFSGEAHTYVSLPSGVQLQAATGAGKLQSPSRKGPYWVVSGLSTKWSFATTKGVVNATATGAARQMAMVSNAQAAIAQTMPMAKPKGAALTTTKPLPKFGAVTKTIQARKTIAMQAPKKQVQPVPNQWLHAAIPTPHHSEVFFIPGAEGRIMPLQLALIHIVPAGWQTHISKYISPSIPVTWHKGLWTTSLNNMAKSDAWVDHVNFEKRIIRIDPTPALLVGIPGLTPTKIPSMAGATVTNGTSVAEPTKPEGAKKISPPGMTHLVSPVSPMSLASAAILKIPGKAPASAAHSALPQAPALPMKPVVVFTTHHDEMLSHAMRRYLKKKGDNLAWNMSRDWEITYGFVLTGSLPDVMNHLMRLYPIDIVGEGVNHTIVVSPAR